MKEEKDWTKEFEAKCLDCGRIFMLTAYTKHADENNCGPEGFKILPKYPVREYYPLFPYMPEGVF